MDEVSQKEVDALIAELNLRIRLLLNDSKIPAWIKEKLAYTQHLHTLHKKLLMKDSVEFPEGK